MTTDGPGGFAASSFAKAKLASGRFGYYESSLENVPPTKTRPLRHLRTLRSSAFVVQLFRREFSEEFPHSSPAGFRVVNNGEPVSNSAAAANSL